MLTPIYMGFFNFITGFVFPTPTQPSFNICLCFKVGALNCFSILSAAPTNSKSTCPLTSTVLPYTALFINSNKYLSKSFVASFLFSVLKSTFL